LSTGLIGILLAYGLAWLGMHRLFAGGIGIFPATTFACWTDNRRFDGVSHIEQFPRWRDADLAWNPLI
jgi:hypothetical protein